MANFSQKTKMPVAVSSRSNLNLRDKHQTTTNFMDLGVAFCRELVPDSEIKDLNMRSFARLDSMRAPTEGDAVVNSRAYFVPYRTICPFFTDMRNNVPHEYDDGFVAIPTRVPTVYNRDLVNAFIGNPDENDLISDFEPQIDPANNDVVYDIVATRSENSSIICDGYNLSPKGARIMKLLNQLGYALNFNLLNDDGEEHSMLYLLSLLKIYVDHYYPSQYAQSEEFFQISYWLKYDNYEVDMKDVIIPDNLRFMFDFIDKVCYNNDYFVSAWDNPNSPNVGAASSFVIPDINSTGQYQLRAEYNADHPVDNTAARVQTATGQFAGITQYALNALRSLTDYMKRHQIVGSRALDRMLARWGVVLTPAKLNRSVYISDFSQSIMFGDVTSTADTEGANLGSYAGKGILPERNATFSYSTDEDGFFMILTSVVPMCGYYQGADRHTKHFETLDFLTPEFDGLGTQAIGTNELYVPFHANKMYSNNIPSGNLPAYDSMIYGYTGRYAEYKIAKDRLTGDYRLASRNAQLDAWHLFRDMDHLFYDKKVSEVKHDINFIRGIDSRQFNRIFNYMGDDKDHIKISHYFNYTLSIPAKPLFETYEFENEDKAQKVSIDVGGSKAN